MGWFVSCLLVLLADWFLSYFVCLASWVFRLAGWFNCLVVLLFSCLISWLLDFLVG